MIRKAGLFVVTVMAVGLFSSSPMAVTPSWADNRTGIYIAITEQPALTRFAEILEQVNLHRALQGPGPYTVFAPSNDALAKLPAGYIERLVTNENRVEVYELLTHHVVIDRLDKVDLNDGDTYDALGRQRLTIEREGGAVFVNQAQIIDADIANKAGVVHIIDQVIIAAP
ncbi:MAG: fasciclin domain-containing protein [Pseudomonadota bacterium]